MQLHAELGETSFSPSDFRDSTYIEQDKERQIQQGMIEKKSYINMVALILLNLGSNCCSPACFQIQAFSVAMKHTLRGERGPFYSDLYSLIAFLPKSASNPSPC